MTQLCPQFVARKSRLAYRTWSPHNDCCVQRTPGVEANDFSGRA